MKRGRFSKYLMGDLLMVSVDCFIFEFIFEVSSIFIPPLGVIRLLVKTVDESFYPQMG